MYALVTLVLCVVVCTLGPCVCQDVSSFGNSLSRCVIFRQVARPFSYALVTLVALCCSVYIGSLCLSESCVCQNVSFFGNSLSRCVIFRQVARPFSYACALCCSVYIGSLCLSGCFTFYSLIWLQPVKFRQVDLSLYVQVDLVVLYGVFLTESVIVSNCEVHIRCYVIVH